LANTHTIKTAIRAISLCLGVILMYLTSKLSIGTKLHWIDEIEHNYWPLFFSRMLIVMLVGIIFLIIDLVLLKILKLKEERFKTVLLIKLLIMIAISAIFTFLFFRDILAN